MLGFRLKICIAGGWEAPRGQVLSLSNVCTILVSHICLARDTHLIICFSAHLCIRHQ